MVAIRVAVQLLVRIVHLNAFVSMITSVLSGLTLMNLKNLVSSAIIFHVVMLSRLWQGRIEYMIPSATTAFTST